MHRCPNVGLHTVGILQQLIRTTKGRTRQTDESINVMFIKRDVIYCVDLTEAQMKEPGSIITAMRVYIDGHVNETVEQCNFRCLKQQEGEISCLSCCNDRHIENSIM